MGNSTPGSSERSVKRLQSMVDPWPRDIQWAGALEFSICPGKYIGVKTDDLKELNVLN